MLSAATTAFARASDFTRATASLAEAFGVGGNGKRSPDTGDLLVQISWLRGPATRWIGSSPGRRRNPAGAHLLATGHPTVTGEER